MERIGVFVCHCGTNIAGTVDVAKVAEELGKEDGVVCIFAGNKRYSEQDREIGSNHYENNYRVHSKKRLVNGEYKTFQILSFRVIDVYGMVLRLR